MPGLAWRGVCPQVWLPAVRAADLSVLRGRASEGAAEWFPMVERPGVAGKPTGRSVASHCQLA